MYRSGRNKYNPVFINKEQQGLAGVEDDGKGPDCWAARRTPLREEVRMDLMEGAGELSEVVGGRKE